MKKVAIMTWFHYKNFGTALQVTALTRTIEKLGYTADVIHYIPHGHLIDLNNNYKNPLFYLKKITDKVNNNEKNKSISDLKRDLAFDNFLNEEIKLTAKCNTDSDLFQLNDHYDAFVCGSDQIWAPSRFNSKYLLDFVLDTNKKVAYAPSIGLSKIEDVNVQNRMKECIEQFKHLSIREEQGQRLIKELCDKEASVVLDPTLLLTADEWDGIAENKGHKQPYILCYFLGNSKQTWMHVKKLSKKSGLPVKIVPIFAQDLNRGFDVVDGVGPREFLNLVKNATFVCTDSFHGTAFAIKYEKPFYTYERFSNKDRNSQNSRIYNLLKLVGLEDRLIKDKSVINDNPLICEYKEAKCKLEFAREKSINYLKDAMDRSTSYKNEEKPYNITNTCCGCSSCSVLCGQTAITIKRNDKGFLTALIDQNKCVRCGLCKQVCPYNGKGSNEINKAEHSLFMVRSKNVEVLKTSSSGGAGFEISKMLCNQGYDVVGCVYNKEKGEAEHQVIRSGEIEKLDIFQGSKYIQSNTEEVFKDVLNTSERAVIFGTPCQIAGIDRLLKLKKKRDNFILVDLICHGVPTQNLWKKYLKEGSHKHKFGLNPDVTFRDKSRGWREMHINMQGNGKSYVCLDKKDPFYRFFLIGHCYMPACYECAYRTASAAEIRLGDYWGPRYKKSNDGVSMVIAMNDVGEEILKQLKDTNRIELEKMDCIDYWTVQYPQNPIKPVFYDELLSGFKDDSVSLQSLIDNYCVGFEFYSKLQKLNIFLSSIYRK